MPPPPAEQAKALADAATADLVRRLVDERLASQKAGPTGPAATKASETAKAAEAPPDPTVGAKFLACVSGKALWITAGQEAQPKPSGTNPGSDKTKSVAPAAVGVTFYATPNPPLRDPCAE